LDTDEFATKYNGEWIHKIPLSVFSGHGACKRLRLNSQELPCARFLEPLREHNVRISHCELLHNDAQMRQFHAAIDTCEIRARSGLLHRIPPPPFGTEGRGRRPISLGINIKKGLFTANLAIESDADERRRILEELVHKSAHLASHAAQDVLVMGAFHATSVTNAELIAQVSFHLHLAAKKSYSLWLTWYKLIYYIFYLIIVP
jgi:hypothetical protein